MIALICVPWMLIPKPLILFIMSKSHGKPTRKHDDAADDNLIASLREHNDSGMDS